MPTEKPKDFLENFADRDFRNTSSVDVATVTKDANKDDLLFGKKPDPNAPPANDGEPEDDTFKWDESEAVVKKYGQGMWYTDVVVGAPPNARTFRYWGKTRTEVTQALIKAQANAVPLIEDLRKKVVTMPTPAAPAPTNLTPDTKLPYDPVARRSPRELTQEEILNLQELEQSNPLKAYRIKFEALTGYTPEGFAEVTSRSDNMYARRIADEAAFAFQANHAETGDWEPTPGNTALIDAYLKERKWPVTSNNLEIAFQDLKRQGKLVMPAPEAPENPAAPENAASIVEEVPPPPPPVSPPAGSAPNRAPRQEADLLREAAAGLRDMPLDEARSSLTDAFRRQRGAR